MTNPHEYLNSFANYEQHLGKASPHDFNLDRIQELLGYLDNPQSKLRIIHVAGTKGKGSTCAFLASILHHAGYKVGLYTSPHLHRVNERIRVLDPGNLKNREQFPGAIPDEALGLVLSNMRGHIAKIINEEGVLTYFEVLTAIAFDYFAKREVDVAIIETGLGGRLDATNAADALINVITPISLDHTHLLGNTLAAIAAEKAGIIKHTHSSVVIAPQEREAMDVLLRRCKEFGITPHLVNPAEIQDKHIALKGAHQTVNAATALAVVDLLKRGHAAISDEAITEGLKNIRWSGRFEEIRQDPTVVVDCAHNAASARALAQTLMDVYPYRPVILVLGVSEDKDVAAICNQLKDSATKIILTKANHPRAHCFNAKEAEDYFKGKAWSLEPDLKQALGKALKAAQQDDVILVTGSVFTVGQAMEHLCTNTKV